MALSSMRANSPVKRGRALRIAVIANNLRLGGGETVGQGLLAALARVAPGYSYYITIPGSPVYERICRNFPSCRTLQNPRRGGALRRIRHQHFTIPAGVRKFRPDIIWALGNMGLPRPGCPQGLLIQSAKLVYPVRYMRPVPLRNRIIDHLRRCYLRLTLSGIDLVFCQTETMRRRFLEKYRFRGRVEICSNAGTVRETHPGQSGLPAVIAALKGKFIFFCLAKYYPHKNLEVLVDLFRIYRRELRDCVVLLTIAPEDGRSARRLLRRLTGTDLEGSIVNLGPIPHPELAGYYEHCRGLILPTLLESFSGTYLEAMRFSCPILTSDLDFAREICGPAALYFDPRDPRSIRDAMLRLKNDPGLASRLIENGETRLRQFPRSWDEIAKEAISKLLEIAREG